MSGCACDDIHVWETMLDENDSTMSVDVHAGMVTFETFANAGACVSVRHMLTADEAAALGEALIHAADHAREHEPPAEPEAVAPDKEPN